MATQKMNLYTIIFVSEHTTSVKLIESEKRNLITTTHSNMMNAMEDIDGMKAVLQAVNRDKNFFTTMVDKNANKDCIFAIKGCAVTCICRDDVTEFITDNKNDLVLNADKLYNYLYKDNEIFLVVGNTDGLKSELVKDIKVTCKKAGFDENQTKEILQKCNCCDNEKCIKVVERSEHTLLRILVSPTVEEFEDFMKQALLLCCCRMSLKIIYCGHGTIAGSICLFDEDYSGVELCELLENKTLCHYPTDVGLYLNCCYAINIVSKMTKKDALESLKSFASLILNDDADETIVNAYYGDQEANDKFQKSYIQKLESRSLHVKQWSNQRLNLFPLSVGSLKADGLLRVALGLKEDVQVQEQECISYRSKWYQEKSNKSRLDDLFIPTPSPTIATENPKVKVFCAGRGDSALFSWNTWNILIDGGLTYTIANPPCFCNEISKLNKLDLVVLTHGDADHVNGLLP